MADMDELEITIDEEGNVSIKVVGGSGGGCVELTKEIEEALGVVTERELQAEFYQEEVTQDQQVEQQGGE